MLGEEGGTGRFRFEGFCSGFGFCLRALSFVAWCRAWLLFPADWYDFAVGSGLGGTARHTRKIPKAFDSSSPCRVLRKRETRSHKLLPMLLVNQGKWVSEGYQGINRTILL